MDARQASFLHGLLLHLAVPDAVRLVEEIFEVVKLFTGLLPAIRLAVHHSCRLALNWPPTVLLAKALARHLDDGILRRNGRRRV